MKFGHIIDTIPPFPTFPETFKHACQAFRRDTSKMSCCIEQRLLVSGEYVFESPGLAQVQKGSIE